MNDNNHEPYPEPIEIGEFRRLTKEQIKNNERGIQDLEYCVKELGKKMMQNEEKQNKLIEQEIITGNAFGKGDDDDFLSNYEVLRQSDEMMMEKYVTGILLLQNGKKELEDLLGFVEKAINEPETMENMILINRNGIPDIIRRTAQYKEAVEQNQEYNRLMYQ